MKADTQYVTIGAPKLEVFRYLTDIQHLPTWAAGFCHKLEVRDGTYYVTSPDGVLVFEMHGDAETGAVDLRFGPGADRLVTFPMRVVAVNADVSLVTFTAWQIPGIDDDVFAGQVASIREELDELKRLVEM
ncbi:MAG: hypothetical protein MJE77_29860 [Proteobacteria bacterium]|nr:hypothetical protein [Pseudomonadota bacterium]